MEYESQLSIHSPVCSSTCITNDISKRSSEGRVKSSSSHGFRKSKNSMLSGDQEIIAPINNFCVECLNSSEPLCHVKLESLDKLKESTKQLLCLLEEIQSKTRRKNKISDGTPEFITNYIKTLSQDDVTNKENDIFNTDALKNLEDNTNKLDVIYIADDHDDCTVYRRLTRKCHCLNHPDYNDFVIHFNEDSKYITSNLGEIIKNMRILRKFLYMGGSFTRNALMFLHEGMMESPHSERVEMSQACANADICNVFEDQSIVIVLISWPCKNKYFGDYVTQALAAGFLNKLAEIEEGRRYLNYSSKISNDIKRVLRKKGTSIEVDTVESLNATLNLLKPVFARNVTITYFNKSMYEGVGKRIICDLVKHRYYMTFNEVLLHLETLEAYSQYESSRTELSLNLPLILILFKHLLMEYDNSEINMTVTSILNNLISKNKDKEKESVNSNTITETATQVITVMRSEECQFPSKKARTKKINKSKIGLGASIKFRQSSKRQEWESINNVRTLNTSLRTINRSKKFHNDRAKKIFVPLQE